MNMKKITRKEKEKGEELEKQEKKEGEERE